MELTKTVFTFQDDRSRAGEVTAMIQRLGDAYVWTVKYFDWRKSEHTFETVPEMRRRQFVNQTRARQIVAEVLKEAKI